MKVLVLDDENLAVSRLNRILNELGIENITSFTDPLEALSEISKSKFDVVFLDISMPNMDGLEFANRVLEKEPSTFIVFQTAYEEYALDAFRSGGVDYLLKPISKESVTNAINRIEVFLNTKQSESRKILAKSQNRLHFIDINDIYYIKADLDEVIIKIKDNEVYLRRKISDFEKMLKGRNFFRVHRSYIVNIDKIKSMQTVEQSKILISFDNISQTVTSSKDGAKEFREYLERRSL